MSKTCTYPTCTRGCYGEFCLMHKPKRPIAVRSVPRQRKPLPRPTKRIRQRSDKELAYQVWKETVARPFLIIQYGNRCICCGRSAKPGEKLDIEHTLGKGAHPELKRSLDNLTLMCRIPCHANKTDGKSCEH